MAERLERENQRAVRGKAGSWLFAGPLKSKRLLSLECPDSPRGTNFLSIDHLPHQEASSHNTA